MYGHLNARIDGKDEHTNGHTNGHANGHTTGHTIEHKTHHRDPSKTQIYLVGGGIASLSAASILIRDAEVPPSNIHIFEAEHLVGGAMDGSGTPEEGYLARGGRMLNSSYVCLYDLLDSIPTLEDPKINIHQQIKTFDEENKTVAHARLVDKDRNKLDVSHMGFNATDRLQVIELWEAHEDRLGRRSIEDFFDSHFLTTNFWYMWATTFAFQPWHSAIEFKRYLHRFIHEFPRISTLSGVDRTTYNQYDSIISPINVWLKNQGVDFRSGTTVSDVSIYHDAARYTAQRLHVRSKGESQIIDVTPDDLVFVTNGSMISSTSIGSTNTPPPPFKTPTSDPAWSLWCNIAASQLALFSGKPENFMNREPESKWESFTATMSDSRLLDLIIEFSGNVPGSGALCTFKDSAWLMSIVVPHQPHFRDQPKDVTVLWGYGLYVEKVGNHIKKPMSACTGHEILEELLYNLGMPSMFTELASSIKVIPAMLPYITSQFLTRVEGDRPKVVPEGSQNFAWLGQWTEIPRDTVFTVEYSVRSAMMAVYQLMGLKKSPPKIYKGEHHPEVIYGAAKALMT